MLIQLPNIAKPNEVISILHKQSRIQKVINQLRFWATINKLKFNCNTFKILCLYRNPPQCKNYKNIKQQKSNTETSVSVKAGENCF